MKLIGAAVLAIVLVASLVSFGFGLVSALSDQWHDGWTAFFLIWPHVLWSFLLWSWWITRPQRAK